MLLLQAGSFCLDDFMGVWGGKLLAFALAGLGLSRWNVMYTHWPFALC
jgi:hypothetical protein